jgi:hypothetical protein
LRSDGGGEGRGGAGDGGGGRGRAAAGARLREGQVPDERGGGDRAAAQVRAAAAAGGRPVRSNLAGVREVAAVREARQPLLQPGRRQAGARGAGPQPAARVRALRHRQPVPRHRGGGQGARPVHHQARPHGRRLH